MIELGKRRVWPKMAKEKLGKFHSLQQPPFWTAGMEGIWLLWTNTSSGFLRILKKRKYSLMIHSVRSMTKFLSVSRSSRMSPKSGRSFATYSNVASFTSKKTFVMPATRKRGRRFRLYDNSDQRRIRTENQIRTKDKFGPNFEIRPKLFR